jgi:hypothetical protein
VLCVCVCVWLDNRRGVVLRLCVWVLRDMKIVFVRGMDAMDVTRYVT